jgi:hypothetical protein
VIVSMADGTLRLSVGASFRNAHQQERTYLLRLLATGKKEHRDAQRHTKHSARLYFA